MAAKPFASGHILAAADVNDLVGVYDRTAADVDVVSTVAETTLYSKSIAAAAMTTDRMLVLMLAGDILQNATAAPTIRVKFGATTVWGSAVGVTPNDADRRPWNLQLWLQNIGSASVQRAYGHFCLGDPSAGTIAGQGSQYGSVMSFGGSSAINTASAVTLAVTVQWDTNSANASFRKLMMGLDLR